MPLSYRRISQLFIFAALLSLSTPSGAVVRTVALDGSGEYRVIQNALFASTVGDTVLVSPGTYSWTDQESGDEHGLIRYWRDDQDGVDLISTGGPEVTILDAEGMGRVFFANGNNSAVDPVQFMIKGFTLRNGYATKILQRTEQEGGGAALHLCDVIFEDCNFENNVAEFGGGVWLGGVGVYEFRNCRFTGNRAEKLKPELEYEPFGGGVCVFGPVDETIVDSALFENCTFIGNHSDYRGGGLFTSQDHVRIVNSLFAENTCSPGPKRGGTAIYGFNPHEVILDGVTVRDHDSAPGAAVLMRDYVWTLPDPPLNIFTKVRIQNTLIARGDGTGLNLFVEGINDFDISCTNQWGGVPGDWVGQVLAPYKSIQGNLNVDPLFCSAWGDRRRVAPGSPMLAENNSCATDIGRIIGGNCASVRVEDPENQPPVALGGLQLIGASPNPFNPRTNIQFELEEAVRVRLDVYDSRGRHVRTLLDETRGPGLHQQVFDGGSLSSGVYHLRMQAGDQVRTDSMVLVR